MRAYQLINALIKENQYKTYLEIGVFEGETFKKIVSDVKDSVDPYDDDFEKLSPEKEFDVKYRMSSDVFFEKIAPTMGYKYDIIFIDGSHLTEQVDKDLENSLNYLNENGTIVLHDCNPQYYEIQIVPRKYEYWSGNVWKSIIKIKQRDDLNVSVIDTDMGLGIVTKNKKEKKITIDNELDKKLEWDYFNENRNDLLNIITETDFLLNLYKNKF